MYYDDNTVVVYQNLECYIAVIARAINVWSRESDIGIDCVRQNRSYHVNKTSQRFE